MHRVQEHIIKMYDNIASLKFVKNTAGELVVTTLVSAEQEEMDLLRQVMTDSRVEDWMNVVLQEMRLANRNITKTALFYYCDNMTRLQWMSNYQVPYCCKVLVLSATLFTTTGSILLSIRLLLVYSIQCKEASVLCLSRHRSSKKVK